MDSEHLPDTRYIRVDVRGDSEELWQKFRSKLLQGLNDLLDAVVDPESGTTLREETQNLAAAVLNHAKARLARPGVEIEKLEAEIHRLYTQAEADLADARKKRAEAAALEFDTKVKRMRLFLGGAKALLTGDEGEEAVLFGTQIDTFIKSLDEFSSS